MKKIQFKVKYGLYLLELLVILALVLGGLLHGERKVFEATAEEIRGSITIEGGSVLWCSESLELKPGVYRVSVNAEIPADSAIALSLQNQSPRIFREILSNELVMCAGQSEFTLEATITAGVEAAFIRAKMQGAAAWTELTKVTLYQTGKLYFVLAFCFVLAACGVNLLLYLYRLIRQKRISGEQQMVVWVLAAVVLTALFPSLADYLIINGDGMYYLSRIEAWKEALTGEGVNAGLLPTAYLLVPALFRVLGFTLQTSYQLFVYGVTILVTVIAYCCLRHCSQSRKTALFGTVIYVLFPWRTDCFYRQGAVLEWLCMTFLPLLLCGVYLLFGRKGGKKEGKGYLEKLLAVLACLVAGVAIYQVNDIAFESAPVYLYQLNIRGEEAVRMGGVFCQLALPANLGKILLIQALALAGSYLMLRAFFQKKWTLLLGVALYLTSPYRLDLCFVQENWRLSLVWALVPFYLYGMMKVKADRCRGRKGLATLAFTAILLSLIGYGSDVMFCLLAALGLLTALVFKKARLLVPVLCGGLFWLVGNTDFVLYLFTNRPTAMEVTLQNITPRGYAVSDFLTSYAYLEGKPGLGLGMLFLAVVYAYVRFVNGGGHLSREKKFFGALGFVSLFLATRYFPWELVQRVGVWALKFVSLLETPALFTGFAGLLLPVVFLTAVEEMAEK